MNRRMYAGDEMRKRNAIDGWNKEERFKVAKACVSAFWNVLRVDLSGICIDSMFDDVFIMKFYIIMCLTYGKGFTPLSLIVYQSLALANIQ